MRAAVALAAACALLLAGCTEPRAERAERRVALAPGGERWQAIARTLSGPEDPRSPNVCDRGEPACLDEVVGEMRRRHARLAADCDHLAAFAFMYLRVTEQVRARRALSGDPTYLNHLDAVFAQQYFAALDAHLAGRDGFPRAWSVAFEAADRRQVNALGDMLLGMNAHISRDLPFALERIGLRTAEGRSGKLDFDRVDIVLDDVQRPMLAEASRELDPTIATFNLPALGFTTADVAELLSAWRAEAWRNARTLVAARDPLSRSLVAARIERNAESRARVLQTALSYALLGGTTEERDRFCARRR